MTHALCTGRSTNGGPYIVTVAPGVDAAELLAASVGEDELAAMIAEYAEAQRLAELWEDAKSLDEAQGGQSDWMWA